jgi:anhydro-N-acetylmuramic acid kinase
MERLIAGAMSGTSADGVDVAIVRVAGRGTDMTVQLIAHHHHPYDARLRETIFSMRGGEPVHLTDLARCTRQVSLAYAAAVNGALAAAGIGAFDLAAVAAHGQTMFHAPQDTMQVLDPALVAAEVGCPVVSDFRRADCAAGGQGAPLVPFADYVLFRHPTRSRALINIGGIANVTFLPAGALLNDVVAFDTGPGNCVSDWLCRTRGPFGLSWDVDGAGASRGRVIPEVRDRFLSAPYFSAAPPKSTDAPAMIAAFAHAVAEAHHDLNDLLATAAYLTASTIATAVAVRVGGEKHLELIVSGGGLKNKAMMGWLKSLLPDGATIRPSSDLTVPAEAKEAVAFALLAAASLDGAPSNVPSATGARRPVVLGSITPKP